MSRSIGPVFAGVAALVAVLTAPHAAAEGLDGLLRRSAEDLLRKAAESKPRTPPPSPAGAPAAPAPPAPSPATSQPPVPAPAPALAPVASVGSSKATASAATGATLTLAPPAGPPPSIAWEAKLGFRDWGAIAVVNGVVIGANSTGQGGVYAVDAATGRRRWRAADTNTTSVAPVSDGTRAFHALGRPESLTAFRLDTGKVAWSRPFDFLPRGEPVLVDGLVIAQHADGFLYAFDAATGAERWKTQYARRSNWCGAGRPAVADGVVYVSSGLHSTDANTRADFLLHAFDAKTGRELWRYVPLAEYPDNYGACLAEVLAVDGTIVAAGEDYLYGVDRASGRELYRVELRDPDGRRRRMYGLVPLDGVVYGMTEKVFRAMDAKTGRTLWSLPGEYRDQFTATAAYDGVVYFQGRIAGVDTSPPDQGEILHALDPRTRRLLWSFTYRGEQPWSFGSPVVADGAVYVATYKTLLKLK